MLDRFKRFLQNHLVETILVLLALTGVSMLRWATATWGVGVEYDGVFYLTAADNFLRGLGFSRVIGAGELAPLIHYPPGYPFSIVVLRFLFGMNAVTAASMLTALWFGVMIFLVGYLVYHYTRFPIAGVLSALVVLSSSILVDLHLLARSEPQFLVFLLLVLLILDKYLEHKSLSLLLVAAVLAAGSYLTRYVGVTVVALGLAVLVLFNHRAPKRRLRDALVFGLISGVPALAWLLRNWLSSGTVTNRAMIYSPLSKTQWNQFLNTVYEWFSLGFFPAELREPILFVFVIALVAMGMFWFRGLRVAEPSSELRQGARFAQFLVLFIVGYLAFLSLSLMLFDASTPINSRILAPVYVLGIVLVFLLVWKVVPVKRMHLLGAVISLGLLVFIALEFRTSMRILSAMRAEGRFFTGERWQTSETIAAIGQLPRETTLYTNEALPVYFLTGRFADPLPENFNPVKDQPNPDFAQKMDAVYWALQQPGAALAIFDSFYKYDIYAPLDELTEGLVLWRDLEDGVIYTQLNR